MNIFRSFILSYLEYDSKLFYGNRDGFAYIIYQTIQYFEQYSNNLTMSDYQEFIIQILECLEAITANAGKHRHFEDPNVLVDHLLYFDICQLIFPQLNIPLIKLREENTLRPSEKMQQLVQLLSEALDVDLSHISGQRILESSLEDIQQMIELLYEYSKFFKESHRKKPRPQSEDSGHNPHHIDEIDQKLPLGGKRRGSQEIKPSQEYCQLRDQRLSKKSPANVEQEEYLAPQPQFPKKRPLFSAKKKQQRNEIEARRNINEGLVIAMLQEKGRWLNAAKRVNKKNRLEDVEHQKKGFSMYLNRTVKQNIANTNREAYLREKSTQKRRQKDVKKQDLKQIDNFFQSFTLKIRDAKVVYLRRMKNVIRRQERDRFCHFNRIKRQTKQQLQKQLQGELKRQNNEYRIRSNLLKERKRQQEQQFQVAFREERVKATRQRKELKEAKKRQLYRIESILREDNERVLMELEEGGNLEKVIMQMYKNL